MWSLLGIPVVLIGLLIRLNPLVVVTAAAVVAGIGGGLEPLAIVGALGKAFNDARYISLAFLVLPLVGLLETAGMQAKARAMVARLSGLTVGRLLAGYLLARQISASLGLLSLGGQAAMVRPLIAPMAESAEAAKTPDISEDRRMLIRAHAAGADNVGAFFGEDIFVALGSVLLVQAVLEQNHIRAEPLRIALWAIPTAIVAFVVHGARLLRLDRRAR
jgi:uncharacterized membrane protein